MQLKPTGDGPTTAGYVPFHQLTYPDLRPWQVGVGTATPVNTLGWIGHHFFNKVGGGVSPVKNIIQFQLRHL
jgi:hypothetical protein